MVAAETKLFMHASSEISKMFLQVVADGIGILGSALRKFSLQMVADENGNFRSVLRKKSKKILTKLDRIFKINFPTTCREYKTHFQPSWLEVQNPTSAQPGQKLKSLLRNLSRSENSTSTQVV